MTTYDSFAPALTSIFAELTEGAAATGGFVLNAGDAGLLASLDRLDAAAASASSEGGATIAAHAAHLAYGLSLMNRWASEGGNPFAGARWDEASRRWEITVADPTGERRFQTAHRLFAPEDRHRVLERDRRAPRLLARCGDRTGRRGDRSVVLVRRVGELHPVLRRRCRLRRYRCRREPNEAVLSSASPPAPPRRAPSSPAPRRSPSGSRPRACRRSASG